jgi:hypothetical protein
MIFKLYKINNIIFKIMSRNVKLNKAIFGVMRDNHIKVSLL